MDESAADFSAETAIYRLQQENTTQSEREREEKSSSYKKTARDVLREHCKQKRGRACSSLPSLVHGAEAKLALYCTVQYCKAFCTRSNPGTRGPRSIGWVLKACIDPAAQPAAAVKKWCGAVWCSKSSPSPLSVCLSTIDCAKDEQGCALISLTPH
jgi:hypothetical protein